jgi:aspartate 1-decarboxylase
MLRAMCKSKIHRATVTGADLNYAGSITVDSNLMEAADLLPYERVQVVNINNGERFETYVIEGEPDSGTICLNGAAARLAAPGDLVIIMSYAWLGPEELVEFAPRVIRVDSRNRRIAPG